MAEALQAPAGSGEKEAAPTGAAGLRDPPRLLPALLVLFFGSGCSALIYEIVWFQLLELVIGSSAVSLGVLLGTFMGGMCLGALAMPRIISSRRHPLRVYALLELGIGASGIAVLFGMPLVSGVYAAGFAQGFPGILLRAAVCAVCLLPPTILMGATLPAIAGWVENVPQGISWLGFFYGGNIAGAVFGCLLAGFYLLRVHDLATATYWAAGVDGAVGIIGLALSKFAAYRPPAGERQGGPPDRASGVRLVYLAIGMSGLTALGAEVVWTRLLSLLIGGTVFTFSIILAVFLTGLGAGSGAGAVLSRSVARPRMALGWCQMLLALGIAWAAFMITRSIPYWPIQTSAYTSPWIAFQIDLVRCLWALLPPAFFWGASFPLALAAAASSSRQTGRMVGEVYAANTLGAILGAIAFSILVIPSIGTHGAQRLLIGISMLSAVLLLAPAGRTCPASGGTTRRRALRCSTAVRILGAALVAGALAWSVAPIPPGVIAYGRYFLTYTTLPVFLYCGDGMNSSVAVSEWPDGVRSFHVSGKVEASTEPADMKLQHMLGHLPAQIHPDARSVLIIGFGSGVTAGSFVPYPGIERIVICEIEPLIPRVVSGYFEPENHHVLSDPRVELLQDDARHFLFTTREKFDIITSDPIHPWVKGAATLYTREYFELVKEHLKPGGLVTQWVPLYESDADVVKSEMATFFEAFPDGTVWGNSIGGEGYDTVLLGHPEGVRIDVDGILRRLDLEDYAAVAQSLREAGFPSPLELLATYAGCARGLKPWLQDAQINHDRDLRLQYLAGMGLNLRLGDAIYQEILSYHEVPEGLFVLDGPRGEGYRKVMQLPPDDR
jgi:spermidine synthase